MKKIILLTIFLFIGFAPCFAENGFMESEYKSFLNNFVAYKQNVEESIIDDIKDINFSKNENYEFRGNLTKDGKIVNLKLKKSMLETKNSALILQKLEKMPAFGQLQANPFLKDYTNNKLLLTISAPPEYQQNKIPMVSFNLNYPKMEGTQTDFISYLTELEKNVKSNWEPIKGQASEKVLIRFVVDKDGNLILPKIIKSSNNEENDKRAIEAIEKATPFKALPYEFRGLTTIEFALEVRVSDVYANEKIYVASLDVDKEAVKTLKPYLKYLKGDMLRNWASYKTPSPYKIKINLTMNKNGELSNIKVSKSSNIQAADEMAIKAIEKATPVNIPKDILTKEMVPLLVIFEYTPEVRSSNKEYTSINGHKYTGPIDDAIIPVNGRQAPASSRYYQMIQNTK